MNTEEALEDLKNRIPNGWLKVISCDSGWNELLAELRETLVAIDSDFVIFQIKEKFGGLRFYAEMSYNSDNDRVAFDKAIHDAEVKSYNICELTGKPGVMMKKGFWLKTLDPETAPEGFEIVKD